MVKKEGAKDGGGGADDAPVFPPEPPAGGLDQPPVQPPLEVEAVPGESTLSEDERSRWIILHVALPRTIMTCDMTEGRSTEHELNDVISSMAWGTIDPETSEFVLESEDPTLEPPHSSLISYTEYVARTYPADAGMEDEAREENIRMAAQKRNTCTNPGEPVVKFRPVFDQVVKNLVHSNKSLTKAFDIKRVCLNEWDMPEDPSKEDAQNIMRLGRHQILPSFWSLLIHLAKMRRRFSIVFRTFDQDQLKTVQRELKYFCQGQHPAFSGLNKTQKPPPMNGEKNSRDVRLMDENIGSMSRMSGRFEFAGRPSTQSADAAAVVDAAPEAFTPTVYEVPPFHTAYAGLMHQILDGANTAAVIDDYAFWIANDRDPSAGKLILVDHGGGFAETKVQHIIFDGNIGRDDAHCVDVRDVVSGEPLPFEAVSGIFTHRVDLLQAAVDAEYFVKALEDCELRMTQKIIESRRVLETKADDAKPETLKTLPPKEYLYRTVIPALLPALEACQRDRPADPIEFIAFYMLRHPRQYSKSLKG